MRALLDNNPEYQQVTIIRVNWDEHSRSDITKELKVTQRSTLVMFNDGKEIGRVVARTSAKHIEPLFKAAI